MLKEKLQRLHAGIKGENGMIAIRAKGDFSKAEGFLKKLKDYLRTKTLEKYGQMGVDALAEATPKRTGLTAASWFYKIEQTADSATIIWSNTNRSKGELIAVLIQYGHATKNGGYVQGRDYINPALQPVFDTIANDAWEEVKKL